MGFVSGDPFVIGSSKTGDEESFVDINASTDGVNDF